MTTASSQSHWQPFRESLKATAVRTVTIAGVVGVVIAWASHGRIAWPAATVIALWPSLGGHAVELLFLNWLRARLPSARRAQVIARLVVWSAAGAIFALLLKPTSAVLGVHPPVHLPIWLGMAGFLVIELIAHLALELRGRPSFYNARG